MRRPVKKNEELSRLAMRGSFLPRCMFTVIFQTNFSILIQIGNVDLSYGGIQGDEGNYLCGSPENGLLV